MVEDHIAGTGITGRNWTLAQRRAISEELHRIVVHPAFKGSNRCVTLLRFLVDHALAGEEIGTKERTLGIEVFGRDAAYDTNSDPIVRRTANEIRKRLAQCYLDTQDSRPVRIHLQRGNYLPEFEFVAEEETQAAPQTTPPEACVSEIAPPVPAVSTEDALPKRRDLGVFSRTKLLSFAAVAIVVFVCFVIVQLRQTLSPQYELWKPLLASGNHVTLCLSDLTSVVTDIGIASDPSRAAGLPSSPAAIDLSRFSSDTPFSDASVAHRISTRLAEYGVRTDLQPCSALKLQDFSQNPTVLVGGTNNPWALLLLSKLSDARYSIRVDPKSQDRWIEDAQRPADREWQVDGNLHDNDVSVDYGVITRFFAKESGQWVMALSGLHSHGTEAAGKLVTDPAFSRLLSKRVNSKGNLQIVLKTAVVRGTTGSVQVIAVHTW